MSAVKAVKEDKQPAPATEAAKDLNELLWRLRMELKVPKTRTNPMFKSKFRNAEDILEALKPLLPPDARFEVTDSIELIGNRFYVHSSACLAYQGEVVISSGYAREQDTKPGSDAAQITGAASSYARKYALNALFLIDDTKDPDEPEDSEAKPTQGRATPPQQLPAVKELLAKEVERIGGAMKFAGNVPELESAWNTNLSSLQNIRQVSQADYKALDDLYLSRLAELQIKQDAPR